MVGGWMAVRYCAHDSNWRGGGRGGKFLGETSPTTFVVKSKMKPKGLFGKSATLTDGWQFDIAVKPSQEVYVTLEQSFAGNRDRPFFFWLPWRRTRSMRRWQLFSISRVSFPSSARMEERQRRCVGHFTRHANLRRSRTLRVEGNGSILRNISASIALPPSLPSSLPLAVIYKTAATRGS